jgi:ATP phosphoribosyltransferase regulatory subunit
MGRVSRAVGFALYLDLLSELYSSEKEYDADVLLLYDESVAATEVISKRSELIANGKSVSAQRSVPEKQRFGEILDMRRG